MKERLNLYMQIQLISEREEYMKKERKAVIITVGVTCFVLVMVMCMQFKIVKEVDFAEIDNMRKIELETELAKWKAKNKEIEEKLTSVSNKINEYRNNSESNTETETLIQTELKEIDETMGLTNVGGEGIIITMNDSNSETLRKLNADDLLLIVNYLKEAGAEAISINDERVLVMTDIVDINNTFVRINTDRVDPPFIIKAIGNKSYLESVLIGNGGYVEDLKKLGFNITIDTKEYLTINKYDKEINVKYIK